MRNLIIFILILVLIIGFGLWSDYYLQRNSDEMSAMLSELHNQVEKGAEPTAYKKIDHRWSHSKHLLELLVDHKEFKPIDDYLGSLEEYLKDKSRKPETLSLINQVNRLIENVPHIMELRYENLF